MPFVIPYRSRGASVQRDHLNASLKRLTSRLTVQTVLNLGAKPNQRDKQGGRYEDYFPHAQFYTSDLAAVDDPRHWQADLMALPEEVPQYDLVLCMSVLEHVERPWVAAQNVARLVKPGGHLFVQVPFIFPVHEGAYFGDHWRMTPSGVRILFTDYLEFIKCEVSPSCIVAVKDTKNTWGMPNSTYSGSATLFKKPLSV